MSPQESQEELFSPGLSLGPAMDDDNDTMRSFTDLDPILRPSPRDVVIFLDSILISILYCIYLQNDENEPWIFLTHNTRVLMPLDPWGRGGCFCTRLSPERELLSQVLQLRVPSHTLMIQVRRIMESFYSTGQEALWPFLGISISKHLLPWRFLDT